MAAAEICEGYVTRKGISKLIQWITAELIKAEPENPLAFIHELTGQTSEDYSDQKINALLEASVKGISSKKIHSNFEIVNLEQIMQSLQKANSPTNGSEEGTSTILDEIMKLTKSEYCFLHHTDVFDDTIILSFLEEPVKVSFGEGLLGAVASSKNIMSASHDDMTENGLQVPVRSIMAAPVIGLNDAVMGVVQVVNKLTGESFTRQDEALLSIFSAQLSRWMDRGMKDKVDLALVDLFETVRTATTVKMPLSSLIFTITRRTHEVVASDRCTLFVCDPNAKQMWSMQGEINIRIPIDKGIAGACATSGEVINIPDAYEDSRFNPAFDKRSGYHTKTILCIPMKHAQTGNVVGVLQLINKHRGIFTEVDAKLLTLILEQAAPAFVGIESFQKGNTGPEMPSQSFSSKRTRSSSSPRHSGNIMPKIEECEEDIEDRL